jgi:hypothetical protein
VTDYLSTGYNPAKGGCTICSSQDTTSLDGVHGRRCADHAPRFDGGDVAAYIRTVLRLPS